MLSDMLSRGTPSVANFDATNIYLFFNISIECDNKFQIFP